MGSRRTNILDVASNLGVGETLRVGKGARKPEKCFKGENSETEVTTPHVLQKPPPWLRSGGQQSKKRHFELALRIVNREKKKNKDRKGEGEGRTNRFLLLRKRVWKRRGGDRGGQKIKRTGTDSAK